MATTLRHLVFCSTVQIELSDAELLALLHKARTYNECHHITGLLLYHVSQFVAVLEGPAPAVGALYERIRTDARHHNVQLLSDGPAVRRSFPGWNMGFVADCPAALCPPPPGYFSPTCPRQLADLAPEANPHLLNLLREFMAVQPGPEAV